MTRPSKGLPLHRNDAAAEGAVTSSPQHELCERAYQLLLEAGIAPQHLVVVPGACRAVQSHKQAELSLELEVRLFHTAQTWQATLTGPGPSEQVVFTTPLELARHLDLISRVESKRVCDVVSDCPVKWPNRRVPMKPTE